MIIIELVLVLVLGLEGLVLVLVLGCLVLVQVKSLLTSLKASPLPPTVITAV